jgi:hypothetical protein
LAILWIAAVQAALAQGSAAKAWKEIEQIQRLMDENLDRDRTDEALLSGQWVLMQVHWRDLCRRIQRTGALG